MEKSPEAFRTISEAAEEMGLPQHVLRFWETKFPQIKPLKRGGGRRYYRPQDIELLKGIRYFLYEEGYTIKGLQKLMKERGARFVSAMPQSLAEVATQSETASEQAIDTPQPGQHLEPAVAGLIVSEQLKNDLKQALDDLQEARKLLSAEVRVS